MTRNVVILLGLVALLVANVILTHNLLTKPFPGMNDFMSRWEGARSFFQDGVSPYSDQATANIQNRIYGRSAMGDEDPGLFVYPFYTVFIVAPTIPLNYAWASAVWMVLLEACLIVAFMLILNLFSWQPPLWLMPILLIWALMDYFAGRGLFLGQPSHVVYLLQILTIWALFKPRWDIVAGVALAISTFKPQMGYLLVPILLIWAMWVKRYRFVMAFIFGWALLMGVSFILQPDWFTAWVNQVRLYPDYTAASYPDTGSPIWIIVRYYLQQGALLEWAVNGVFLFVLLWAWYAVLVQRKHERLLWAITLTLVVTHIIALRTATPHFVVFNLALIFYFKQIYQRWGGLPVLLLVIGLFAFHWAQFFITVQGRDSLEHPSMFLILPFVTFGLLLITRRMWWGYDR
ncbi:MAG: hypothetical protein Kow00117_14530 [Phototrophicales bacterium]